MSSTKSAPSLGRLALRLALLSSTMFAGAAIPFTAQAQTASPAGAQAAPAGQVQFNVPPQELDSALTSVADQGGIRIFFTSAELRGMRSNGASGSMSVEQALSQVLTGSGFGWRYREAGTVVIERLPKVSDGAIQLGPVRIEGAGQAGTSTGQLLTSDPGTTEGTRSYAGSLATVGSKAPTTIREIPQSVSVVTRQRIEDRNFTTYDQAMRETTGMVVTPSDHGGSFIRSRGYDTQTQLDGLPLEYDYVHGNGFDLTIFDRLEVVRGPSGLFSGGSNYPSGVVNFVHKRPTRNFTYGGAAAVGSWSYFRGEGDVSGPLFGSDRVRGRLVAAGQDNDTFVDVTHTQRKVVYGALEFDLTEQTTLFLGTTYQDQEAVHASGLPAFDSGELLNVRRSTFIGADWNRKTTTSVAGIADLEHHFDGGAVARLAGRWVDRSSHNKIAVPGSAVDPISNNVSIAAFVQDDDLEEISLDSYFSAPITAMGQEHKLLIGADYRTFDRGLNYGDIGGVATVNVLDPDPGFAEPNIPTYFNVKFLTEQYGVYGQARIKPITPLTLIVGGRVSWWETEVRNTDTSATLAQYSVKHRFTPYYGAVVDLTKNFSLYGAYSEIFVPQGAYAFGGELLPPRTGAQYEAGIKAELFDKNLIGHLALFRIQDDNRALSDPAHPGFSIAAGKVRSEGFEAEISGKILPQWDIYSGYSYTKTKYLSDPLQAGQTFASYTPKHIFNLWTKYTFSGGALHQFSVAGGVRVSSGSFLDSSGVRFKQGTYAVVNTQFGYAVTDDVLVTLNINNVFDKIYYEAVGSQYGGNYYGEPRSAMLGVRAKF